MRVELLCPWHYRNEWVHVSNTALERAYEGVIACGNQEERQRARIRVRVVKGIVISVEVA